MEDVLRKREICQKDLESMVSSSVIGNNLHWVGPQYLVVDKIDEKVGAQVGNRGEVAEESGGAVGMKALAEAMLMNPHLQEKSGLVQFAGCKRVIQTANNFPYVLDACEMGPGENLDRTRPSMAEAEREKMGDSDLDGMKNFRSSDEGEGLPNGISASGLTELTSQNLVAKVKFMCSFGGKILPRPSDGKLRYVGGETRIISVNKGIAYAELMLKLRDMYGLALILKYQLPDEDLDSLVSMSSDEDLENMMEEYGSLDGVEGSCRLRVFLFSALDHDLAHFNAIGDKSNSQQCYVDAVNGFLGSGVGLGKQTESTDSASIQQTQNSVAHKWWVTPSAQESTTTSTVPVQDTANPINLPANAPISSKPLSVDAPISSKWLSVNVPISSKQSIASPPSGASDILMNAFTGQAMRPSAQSYIALKSTESQKDMDRGETITLPQSDHGLHFGYTDPRVLALPSRAGHVFSVPTSNPKLSQDHNMLVSDARLRKVDSKGNFIQLHEEVGVAISSLDRSLDVQPLHVDSRTIVFPRVPSSLCQPPWQDTHDLHQDDYIRMECNQLDIGGRLQQFTQQHAPVLPHLNDHHLPRNELMALGHIDQEQLHKDDMLSNLYIPKFVSSKQTDHTVGSAAALCVVGSDPHSPSLADQQWTGNLQHTEVQHSSISQMLEQSQYGMNVNQYNDQGSRALCPSVSTASIRELNSEQLSHRKALSYEQQYGCRQGMPCEQASQSIHHQELSSAYSDIFPADLRVTPLQTVCEGIIHSELPDHRVMPAQTICERVIHSDGAVRSTSSCVASAIEDQLMAYTGQQNIGGERSGSNQQVNEAESNLAALQNYVATHYTSEYVVPQQSVVPPFHQKPDVSDGLVSHRIEEQDDGSKHFIFSQKMPETEVNAEWIPQLLGSSGPAEPGKSYTGMGFPENVYPNLDSGVNSLNEAQRSEIFKPSERTNANPIILGQLGITGMPTEASQASEIATQMKELGMPLTVSSHGTENFIDVKGLRRLTDDNKVNFTYMQPNVLENSQNTFAGEGEKTSSSSEVVALPININNLQMQNILSLDLPTSQPLQESRLLDTTVCILSSVMDIPSLSADFVSLGYKGEETAPTHATTKDKLDDYVKAELQNVAEAALQPPLLSAPTFSVNGWAQFNVGLNNENSIGRVTEVEVEDNLMIEEIEDSDNDDPLFNAIIVEAEAIVRGLQTIKNADLEELQELGSGTFGTVYHGKWRGSDVAIKRIKNCCFSGRASQQDSLKADFWKEACLLAQLHHPNIVAFYGVISDGPGGTLGTVTEFMVNGSLKQNLQWNDRSIDHRKRIVLATDAAIGMEYLHSKNIVHFDLKCDNLLVNMKDPQRPICKVADFGLSKIKHQTLVSGGARGSLPWMAPELLNGSSSMVSDKVDVFSFGIVMWELLEGKEPYTDMHYGAIIGGIVSNTLRPPVPNQCEASWKSLMERCWATDPVTRPSFTEIVDELRSMLASLVLKGQGPQTSSQAPH
ncbi:uncharacterized protein LOC131046587 isoform X2 [Cryptomeria japonica]|uniref:uncharacterized protein LOC131046587 isoform X2 n=1 Tax=Cryptomeria japonica TaxID=3369 RepID=UPI0027D9E2D7|nr:uncharacterized protein LOC131046587 isoform X2 [Cryptomeria japonica]